MLMWYVNVGEAVAAGPCCAHCSSCKISLIGSAALLSGTTRLTVTVVAIMMESTDGASCLADVENDSLSVLKRPLYRVRASAASHFGLFDCQVGGRPLLGLAY